MRNLAFNTSNFVCHSCVYISYEGNRLVLVQYLVLEVFYLKRHRLNVFAGDLETLFLSVLNHNYFSLLACQQPNLLTNVRELRISTQQLIF